MKGETKSEPFLAGKIAWLTEKTKVTFVRIPSFSSLRAAVIPAIVEGPYYKGVQNLGESSVDIRLVAKCKEEDKYQVERDLNRELKILFDANGINIPFNQIVLNTRDPKEPDKTQYKPKKASTQNFAKEQAELSKDIEEQK